MMKIANSISSMATIDFCNKNRHPRCTEMKDNSSKRLFQTLYYICYHDEVPRVHSLLQGTQLLKVILGGADPLFDG